MGLALYIRLEREIPGFDPFVNGKAVARAGDFTESTAKRLGVKPLMEFFSVDEEAAALAEESGVDSADVPEQWFDPADGLITVRALITELEAHPSSVKGAANILEDLHEFESVLTRANEQKVRWSLAFDF